MVKKYKTHIGVYAAIIDHEEQALLLIRKARGPYTGLFDLPGGSIEEHESLEEALAREINEETGCDLLSAEQIRTEIVKYPYFSDKTGEDYILNHIGILYRATVSGLPRTTGDGLDSDGACWMKFSELTTDTVTPFVRLVFSLLSSSTQDPPACLSG